jgi:inorganic pyrophosphatase
MTTMTKGRYDLPPIDHATGTVNAVIEALRGSCFKFKFDPKIGDFLLHKALPIGAAFPFEFGFLPGTKAEDGDPLDIMVLLDEPTIVGAIVPTRLIGVIEAEQTDKGKTVRNDRLLGVLETPYNPPRFRSLEDIEPQLLAEIEHFFVSFNQMEGRLFTILGRRDAKCARQLINAATAKRRKSRPSRKQQGR